ncbi:MAG: hypothetical protein IPM06_21915 [Rhizobiales bacterium]|nr:hypothetical protein [Hyphomicrobiales bacterium]
MIQHDTPPVASWWDGGQTAQTLDAVLQKGQTMPEKNRFPAVLVPDTAHSLRGEGFDASEDGTGRGTPLVPIAFDCKASNGFGVGEIASTMRSMGHSNSHQNGGGHQAVAFAQNTRDEVREMAVVGALASQPGMKQTSYIRNQMQVRRLTPRECELLQGFPSIRERITVEACTDPQNNTVTVALSCLRWPSNASPVDAQRYPQNANIVESISSMYRADREPLAALSVRTSSADLLHEIRSHGKLMWSASSVAESNRYPPSRKPPVLQPRLHRTCAIWRWQSELERRNHYRTSGFLRKHEMAQKMPLDLETRTRHLPAVQRTLHHWGS